MFVLVSDSLILLLLFVFIVSLLLFDAEIAHFGGVLVV